jgi:DNA polymerase I-like protein with 3'-5' exonuclease and polymerase domains
VFDALDAALPITAQYRRDAPELAHRQKYLRSVFDCIRWFWNVKGYNFKKKEWDHGADWDKAIAFRPANNAFSQKKIALLACEEKRYNARYGFCNDIHDAFMFHCKEELAEECIHNVRMEMERPSTVMLMPSGEGFSVEVEEKIGRNWAEMKSWKKWAA